MESAMAIFFTLRARCGSELSRVATPMDTRATPLPARPILVNNRRTRILGRVSMDMLHVDLGGIEDAGVGSPVTLWGQGLPVEEVAQAAGTVGYELLCALAPRMRK